VPAGVTSTERRAVVEAAIKAGAKNAYVVKEPILAAIGAGIQFMNREATWWSISAGYDRRRSDILRRHRGF
jgi:actin-like ATPase involved in cell morphogenesis